MAFKKIAWVNGNHMLMQSGHKTFDRQVDCVSDGNVIGSVQYSSYIRPTEEVECNGFTNPPGHLRNFDLEMFEQFGMHKNSYEWKKIVELVDRYGGGILYAFFHYVGRRRIVHGFILTDKPYKKNVVLMKFITGPTFKSSLVLNECAKYISVDGAL
jgi:hypothetical protein